MDKDYNKKNKFNTSQYYEYNKMNSTNGRFLISIFVFLGFLTLLGIFVPIYSSFKNADYNELNDETEQNLIVYEYKNNLTNRSVYSQTELEETKIYKNVKNHIILCKTKNCSLANKNLNSTEKIGTFIFFTDGEELGLYDANRNVIIDYFKNYSFDENIYFIEETTSSISSKAFLIIETDKLFIYNVNDKKKSEPIIIDSIVFNPFNLSLNTTNLAQEIFNNHLLIKANDNYKILNYKTGKYISNTGFNTYDCSNSSGQCKFIVNDSELILENLKSDKYTITINNISNLNDLDCAIGNYSLIKEGNQLNFYDDKRSNPQLIKEFDENNIYTIKINEQPSNSKLLLYLKNKNLDSSYCLDIIYDIFYDNNKNITSSVYYPKYCKTI